MAPCTSLQTKAEGVHKLVIPTPFPVGPVNAYILVGDSVTLMDCGPKTKEAWEVFLQQLKMAGYSLRDIDQVVLTHHHVDHCGLLDWILEKRDIPVLAHELAIPWVAQEKDFLNWHKEYFTHLYQEAGVDKKLLTSIDDFIKMMDTLSCRVDISQTLRENDQILGLEGWRVYETPGHAQSHLVFYRQQDRVLICGDHLIKHISSNAIFEPPLSKEEERPKTLLQYRESLARVKRLDVSVAYSGHGDEVYDLAELVDRRLERHRSRVEKIKSELIHEALTPFEICKRIFPAVYEKELALTMSEIIGHLDLLLEENQVVCEKKEGIIRYRGIE